MQNWYRKVSFTTKFEFFPGFSRGRLHDIRNFDPREIFYMYGIPGLCRQLEAFQRAELSKRDGEARCTRPIHSWRWSPFCAFHNLGNAKNILQFKSCLYLSQNSLNQNLISDEDGQVYIHLEENLLTRRLMSINCLIPLDSSFYHD